MNICIDIFTFGLLTYLHYYPNREDLAMNENIAKRNSVLAQDVIAGLEKRNMRGYYAESKEEALEIALSLIPEKSSVARAGSASVDEIGLANALMEGDYDFFNRDTTDDKRAAELFAFDADVFIAGTNAVTKDGVLVNIDAKSNRVAAIAYGPRKVVLIVGMNKITNDIDSALKRARNTAAPINAQRFGGATPCCKKGSCFDCLSPDTICCQFMITRYSKMADRIHVILVNDVLGF